ncbi:hypothetical protein I317_00120 [Kwoniella heveanensis CBS 569]|uniref:NADH dehydrogenase [ubiquinone] 1 alpha subcomplex assembly factor 3 n=1 Tax=Kwoniella heveanensis BCC8398 TaxID=1296120 RepID=A0A1B9H1K3_9TREE|nr:hypothetical protein I316_01063 [Kwoniella heveanensis BCC8398]OCF46032.1 hypothetical protein I317_00120 [Kwoniella heveanensis CBS 569]
MSPRLSTGTSINALRSAFASTSAFTRPLSTLRPHSRSHSLRSNNLVPHRGPAAAVVTKRYFQNILAPNPDSTDAPNLAINKLTPRGFILSDNLVIPGGAIFHSGRAVLWDVDPPKTDKGNIEAMWDGWTIDRFRVFEMVVPRPEILLFGTGQTAIPAPKAVREYISSLGIQLDVMDTRNAASTYNLLAEEGRTVSAALCPLGPIDPRTGEAR